MPSKESSGIAFDGPLYWTVGLLFGAATQVLFLWTVVGLFRFLRFGAVNNADVGLWRDVALATLFAVPHSILLAPACQRCLRAYMPAAWRGCLHCMVTCLCLLSLFQFWSPSPLTIWRVVGWLEALVLIGFYGSWLALFYSLYMTGLGYQTGLTPWWYWLSGRTPPKRKFVTSGVYGWMRHPVYLSFLGLIWFTPHMTVDHLVLTVVWTAYIFIGSVLKDLRLKKYIGEPYIAYARRVPGYPFLGEGILGKWAADPSASPVPPVSPELASR